MLTKVRERYSRQILFSEIGEKGQEKLRKSTVAIVGVGALGTVAAELLIRAGVENLILIDFDKVELSNLQRQALFTEKDIGKNKAVAAKKRLKEINSLAKIKVFTGKLEDKVSLLSQANLVLGCTDHLTSRFLINHYCLKHKIPWIFASAVRSSGYVMPVLPNHPCLRCFVKKDIKLDTAGTIGILNTLTYSIPALQVTLALKILLGYKVEPLLYYYDVWHQDFRKIKVKKNAKCEGCGKVNRKN